MRSHLSIGDVFLKSNCSRDINVIGKYANDKLSIVYERFDLIIKNTIGKGVWYLYRMEAWILNVLLLAASENIVGEQNCKHRGTQTVEKDGMVYCTFKEK